MKFSLWMLVEDAISLVEVGVLPDQWTNDLFSPPRNFDSRKKARHFLNWLKGLGVDVQKYIDALEDGKSIEVPLPFGGGAVGKAVPIGNYVVKFTPDKREAQYAMKLVGHTMDNIARIYDVVQIPGEFIVPESGSKKEIYAIVQEKLSIGAPKKLRVAGDMVYTYLDKFAQPLENIDAAYNFIMKNMMPAKWKNDKDVERLTRQVLDAVKKL
jgi:hypothetical protein